LPKINRLTRKKDFGTVFKKGESLKNNFLVFKILKNYLKKSRFGFIVSKKVSTKAVVRNKIKRRLRVAVFKELHNIKNHADIIIITLPEIKKKKFSEIQNVINDSFGKIGIF